VQDLPRAGSPKPGGVCDLPIVVSNVTRPHLTAPVYGVSTTYGWSLNDASFFPLDVQMHPSAFKPKLFGGLWPGMALESSLSSTELMDLCLL